MPSPESPAKRITTASGAARSKAFGFTSAIVMTVFLRRVAAVFRFAISRRACALRPGLRNRRRFPRVRGIRAARPDRHSPAPVPCIWLLRRTSRTIPSCEELPRLAECLGQAIDFLARVVERKRRATRGRNAEPPEQRHRTMGAGAHRDTGTIDDGGEIVRMRTLEIERDQRTLVLRGADD